MARFAISCFRYAYPCGCASWLDWDDDRQAWVRKFSRNLACSRNHS